MNGKKEGLLYMSEKETPSEAKTEKVDSKGDMIQTCQDDDKCDDENNGSSDSEQKLKSDDNDGSHAEVKL